MTSIPKALSLSPYTKNVSGKEAHYVLPEAQRQAAYEENKKDIPHLLHCIRDEQEGTETKRTDIHSAPGGM